jgi:hypothetical protein
MKEKTADKWNDQAKSKTPGSYSFDLVTTTAILLSIQQPLKPISSHGTYTFHQQQFHAPFYYIHGTQPEAGGRQRSLLITLLS